MSTTNLPPAVTHTASLAKAGDHAARGLWPCRLPGGFSGGPHRRRRRPAPGAKPEQGLISAVIGGFIVSALALLRLDTLIQRIPHEAVIGFTAAFAVIFLASQLRDFFGLKLTGEPSSPRH